MIIWSGWGIMVLIITAVAAFIAMALGSMFHLAAPMAGVVGAITTGMLAGGGIFGFARLIERGQARVFIDEVTHERIEVRPSAGSLFFIPVRFWAFIVPALALAAAVNVYMSPADNILTSPDSVSDPAAEGTRIVDQAQAAPTAPAEARTGAAQ